MPRKDSSKGSKEKGVDYAWYVEMGTSKMPAYPYIRPALEEVASDPTIVGRVAKQWKALWGKV